MRSPDDPPLCPLKVASFPDTASVRAAGGRSLLGSHLAIHVRAAVTPGQALAWAGATEGAGSDLVSAFEGAQSSLGIAWYTHLEEGRARQYFEQARASDERVSAHLPGFQEAFGALVGEALGVPVVRRRGHAGPGVHVFPAHGLCATRGGEIHFDTEGLPEPHKRALRPAFTAVLPLSRVTRGGGLRLWDVRYDGQEDPALALSREPLTLAYAPGDLVLFEGYRLHQIEPFEGDIPRVSATCHVALMSGRWELWF